MPEHRRGRRVLRRVLLTLALTLLAAAAVIGYFMFSPPPLPVDRVVEARLALRAAHAAPDLAPQELERADFLAVVMERLFAEEMSRFVRFRRSVQLDQAVANLLQAARTAESAAAERKGKGLLEHGLRYRDLAARLEAVASEVGALPGERGLQRAYHTAQLAIAQAKQFQDLERLDPLPDALDSAEAAVLAAEGLVDSHLARLHDPVLRSRWQGWIDQTVAATRGGGVAILVEKLNRRCVVVKDRRPVATYQAEFGRKGMADKLFAGDGATPEGRYRVTTKNSHSRFYLALMLDYPSLEDHAQYSEAKRKGLVPRGRGPGGLIEIHGNGGRESDWTDGCVALRDRDMEALFRTAGVGTPVVIVGAARLPGD